jgi:hypothetical protein
VKQQPSSRNRSDEKNHWWRELVTKDSEHSGFRFYSAPDIELTSSIFSLSRDRPHP